MNYSEIEICEPNFHSFIFKIKNNSDNELTKIVEECNHVIQQFSDDYPQTELKIVNKNQDQKTTRLFQFQQEPSYNYVQSQKNNHQQLLIDLKVNSDNYTVIFDHFLEEESTSIRLKLLQKLNPNYCFQKIKKSWEDQEYIGETFIFTAFLCPEVPQEEYRKIADECLNYLVDKNPENYFYQEGEIFNSKIFEYGKPKTDKFHALVIFFDNKKSSEQFEEIYWELDKLLLYHHKIISSYQKGHECYRKLSQEIIKIEEIAYKIQQDFNSQIITTTENNSSIEKQNKNNSQISQKEKELETYKQNLKDLLNLSLNYSRQLRDLEHYQNTIDINGYNYEIKLNQFKNQTGNNLTFFTQFIDEEYKTFQKQIQGDITYCHQGTVILNQSIESIRGLIEILQVESDRRREDRENERDRNLNTTIAFVGTAIGVSGLIATSYPLINQQNGPLLPPKLDHPLHPFSKSIIYSLLGGVSFALIVWLAIIAVRHIIKLLKCQDKK
ncbi:MAG: hypothetical protein AB4062_15575 [Crocosphaera sp.]